MARFSGKIGKGGARRAKEQRVTDAELRAEVPEGEKLPSGKIRRKGKSVL